MNERDISGYQLEKDTGIKQATLGKWKKGSLPTIDKLVTLVNYFQVSSDELLDINIKSNLTENELQLPSEALVEGSETSVATLEEVEEKAIRAAVEKYSGNMSLVAKALNVSRPTLYSKLKKYGI